MSKNSIIIAPSILSADFSHLQKALEKKPKKYLCKTCDFSSNDKKDYSRHLTTRKHKRNNLDNEGITKKTEENLFKCEYCSKLYKYRSGLSKHKKKVHALEFLKEDSIIYRALSHISK